MKKLILAISIITGITLATGAIAFAITNDNDGIYNESSDVINVEDSTTEEYRSRDGHCSYYQEGRSMRHRQGMMNRGSLENYGTYNGSGYGMMNGK